METLIETNAAADYICGLCGKNPSKNYHPCKAIDMHARALLKTSVLTDRMNNLFIFDAVHLVNEMGFGVYQLVGTDELKLIAIFSHQHKWFPRTKNLGYLQLYLYQNNNQLKNSKAYIEQYIREVNMYKKRYSNKLSSGLSDNQKRAYKGLITKENKKLDRLNTSAKHAELFLSWATDIKELDLMETLKAFPESLKKATV